MPGHFNLSNQRSKPKSEWSKSGIPAQSAVQLTLLNKTHSGKTKKCLFYLPRASNNSKSASVLLNLHIPVFRFPRKEEEKEEEEGGAFTLQPQNNERIEGQISITLSLGLALNYSD